MKNKRFAGRKHTEETRRKIAEASKINWRDPKYRERNKGNKGKQQTEEAKRKISVAHIGHKHSEKTRSKMSITHKGKHNPAWKGGKLPSYLRIRTSRKYKDWRLKVFVRDNFTCICCRKVGEEIHAHHIKSFVKYPRLRLDVDNGITLCWVCHSEVHGKKIRLKKVVKNEKNK